jgi:hypothetical protein
MHDPKLLTWLNTTPTTVASLKEYFSQAETEKQKEG